MELAVIRAEEAQALARLVIEGARLAQLVADLQAGGVIPPRWREETQWLLRQYRQASDRYGQASRHRAVVREGKRRARARK